MSLDEFEGGRGRRRVATSSKRTVKRVRRVKRVSKRHEGFEGGKRRRTHRMEGGVEGGRRRQRTTKRHVGGGLAIDGGARKRISAISRKAAKLASAQSSLLRSLNALKVARKHHHVRTASSRRRTTTTRRTVRRRRV